MNNEDRNHLEEFSDDEYLDATFDALNVNQPSSEQDHDTTSSSWNAPSSKSPITEVELRIKILKIHANRNLDAKAKAKAIQVMYMLWAMLSADMHSQPTSCRASCRQKYRIIEHRAV
jgi:hypothetical protein